MAGNNIKLKRNYCEPKVLVVELKSEDVLTAACRTRTSCVGASIIRQQATCRI